MSSRLQQVADHILPSSYTANKIGHKSPEDIVIVSALRTAITRARKGALKDTLPEGMFLLLLFKFYIRKTKEANNEINKFTFSCRNALWCFQGRHQAVWC
jgi:acetyl-CoA acyltransferase 1